MSVNRGALAAMLLVCGAGLGAQEQSSSPPRESSDVHVVVSAANQVINREQRPVIIGNRGGAVDLEAVALVEKPSGKYDLVVRYRTAWLEWAESFELAGAADELAAEAQAVAKRIDWTPLQTMHLSESEAEQRLKQCSPLLSPQVRSLKPPFFNTPTNVEWDEDAGALILQSMAVLAHHPDTCVRADLNLRDGSLICRVVACATR